MKFDEFHNSDLFKIPKYETGRKWKKDANAGDAPGWNDHLGPHLFADGSESIPARGDERLRSLLQNRNLLGWTGRNKGKGSLTARSRFSRGSDRDKRPSLNRRG